MKPLQAGDRCEVIWGMQGEASPNIGMIVIVRYAVGEHSQHGRIWRCEAEYAERYQNGINVPYGMADFGHLWLRKLPPPAPHAANDEAKREVSK